MTVNQVQDRIIDEFSIFEDWMDKYNLLIDLGKDLPVIDPKFKTKDFLIEGCQSKVWLHPEYKMAVYCLPPTVMQLLQKEL